MPEGDTVWRTGRRLHQALAGQRLTRADVRHPRWATVDLTDRWVSEVVTRGKHLLLRTTADDGVPITVHTHLGMEGAWWLYEPGQRWRGGPTHQIRVILDTASIAAVAYRLKTITIVPTAEENTLVGHLGPDLLAEDFDAAEATRRLTTEGARTIAEALMDQRNVAGIGTVYRAEILYLRGLWPWTPVSAINHPDEVVALAHRLLRTNRLRAQQVTTGSLRRGEQHWVYGRAGQPCRRCGTRIVSAELGPLTQERVVYWCPRCQPESP